VPGSSIAKELDELDGLLVILDEDGNYCWFEAKDM